MHPRRRRLPDATRNGDTTRGLVGSQTTPLMAGGLLYFSTGLGTVAAVEPATGEVIWNTGPSDGVRVRQTRGVAYWTDGDQRRVVATLGPKLVSLDARTGERHLGFGEAGEVDLREGLLRPFPDSYWNTAPIIVNDVVVIGSFIPDITTPQRVANKEAPRGDVRGYDVRTGEHVWTFHTIPRENGVRGGDVGGGPRRRPCVVGVQRQHQHVGPRYRRRGARWSGRWSCPAAPPAPR